MIQRNPKGMFISREQALGAWLPTMLRWLSWAEIDFGEGRTIQKKPKFDAAHNAEGNGGAIPGRYGRASALGKGARK